jgi:hypothetical protein
MLLLLLALSVTKHLVKELKLGRRQGKEREKANYCQ